MKHVLLTLLFATVAANATSIGLYPVDDGQGTVGDPAVYAVMGGSFDMDPSGMATISLTFNYLRPSWSGPHSDLGGYTDFGIRLNVGDVLFQVGDDLYGIPLKNHSGAPNGGVASQFASVTAGHFYETTSFLTTDTVLNDPNAGYRRGVPVWLGSTVSDLGSLTETVSRQYGTNTYTVTLAGQLPASFVENVMAHNSLKIAFGSATCANGYLVGEVVPEPVSLSLMGTGLLFFGLLRRKKRQ